MEVIPQRHDHNKVNKMDSILRPFNIRILVAEGIPDGFRLIEKTNWSGLCLICPRNRYSEVKDRKEFSSSGVYILIGPKPGSDETQVYIGESEKIKERLNNHHVQKEFWERAIVFTTRDNMLHKAHIKYLEAKLIEIARSSKRCFVENSNSPNTPNISEFDEADISEFLEEMLLLLRVIGIDILTKAQEKKKMEKDVLFSFVDKKKKWNANGYETSNGFAIRKGSLINKKTLDSLYSTYKQERNQLINNNVIEENDERLIFTIDYEFSSPSTAACIVSGRSANGLTSWKDQNNITLKEYRNKDVQSVNDLNRNV